MLKVAWDSLFYSNGHVSSKLFYIGFASFKISLIVKEGMSEEHMGNTVKEVCGAEHRELLLERMPTR